MKNIFKSLLLLTALAFSVSLTSCKEGTKEKIKEAEEAVVEDTKEAAKSVGEAAEKAGEAVADAAEDAGEAMKEAADDVKEAVSDEIEKVRVQFASGANSKTVENSITGRETVDYVLNVKKGQPMNISMATQHAATYFNIMEPGEEYEAIYNASINGNQFEGVAEESGDYTVRVYMMRSAARRGETAEYRLEMIVGN
jgi:gas vesicle protein